MTIKEFPQGVLENGQTNVSEGLDREIKVECEIWIGRSDDDPTIRVSRSD